MSRRQMSWLSVIERAPEFLRGVEAVSFLAQPNPSTLIQSKYYDNRPIAANYTEPTDGGL